MLFRSTRLYLSTDSQNARTILVLLGGILTPHILRFTYQRRLNMEKKTIGSFIATLRKANGMTQKELAEILNVSDKTLSRWERDEGCPDLSQIPVIAKLFNVTCDELLKGERAPIISQTPLDNTKIQQVTLTQYKTRTFISIGLSILGLITAFICNFAFLKGILGFFLGTMFYTASFICQAIFINKALSNANPKQKVITFAELAFGFDIAFIGFTLPLLLADSYMGLQASSLFLLGSIVAIINILIYAIGIYFVNASFVRKNVCDPQMNLAVNFRNR